MITTPKTVAFNKRLLKFKETLSERVASYVEIIKESQLVNDSDNVEQYLEEVKNLKKITFKSELLRKRLLFLKKENPATFTNDVIISRTASYFNEEEVDLLETLAVFSSKFMTSVREELYISKQNVSEPVVVIEEEVAVSQEDAFELPNYIIQLEENKPMEQLSFDLFS